MTPLLAAYTWDARVNQYVDASGKFVSRARVKAALDSVIEAAGLDIEDAARRLQSGEINASEWFQVTAASVKRINVASAAVAVGGTHKLDPSTLGAVANRIKAQYQYLRDFAREVDAGLPLDGSFLARAKSYADSGRPTFEASSRKIDIAAGYAYERRSLRPGEHCQGCLDQAAMGWQPSGVLAPIGSCRCLNQCRCVFERSKVNPSATASTSAVAAGRSRRPGADRPQPSVTFAKASPKGSGIGQAIANVVSAATGGQAFNGTVNGKKGFQPGNTYGANRKGGGSPVQQAGAAHRSAFAAASKHIKAGTAASKAGRRSIRDAAAASRALQSARAAQKAARSGSAKATRAVASGRASALSSRPTATPTPSPTPLQARVKASAAEASSMKLDLATKGLHDLHAGAKAGTLKPTDIHARVERIARGTTKDELFAAAKAHGAKTEGIATKKALVEHLKGRAHEASKPEAAAKPRAEAASPVAIKPEAGAVESHSKGKPPGSAASLTPKGQSVAEEVAHLYRRASHPKTSFEEIDSYGAKLGSLPRSDVVHIAKQVGLHVGASATKGDLGDKIVTRMRSIKQSMIRTSIIDRPEGDQMGLGAKKVKEPMSFKEGLKKSHEGAIDDRRTTVEQVARHSGMSREDVEATVRDLGAKGALSFDHATPSDLAMAKGHKTFPTDHEGKPYHGFRVDRPSKFEAATADKPAPRSFTDVSKSPHDVDHGEIYRSIMASETPHHRATFASMTPKEKAALSRYSGEGYKAINASLRSGGKAPAQASHLDSLIGRSSFPADTHVYRGIKDLSHYGIKSPGEAVGAVLHDKGYASTSLSHYVAGTFAKDKAANNAILRIKAPGGSKGLFIEGQSQNHESEYVLPRDSKFRITGHGGYDHRGVPILDAEYHHEPHGVGFAEGPEGRFAYEPGDVEVSHPDRFAYEPGDVEITREGRS